MPALAVTLGLVAAAMIGLSDLFGRRVVNASSATTAAAAMQITSAVVAVLLAVMTASRFDSTAFVWACLSGVGMAAGLALYYEGLLRSSSTLVAPIVASLTALVPYLYATVRGAPSSLVAAAGAVVAVLGLVLVTGGAVSASRLRHGVRFGLASGLSYAASTVFFIEAADADGWWPVVGQRAVGAMLLVPLAIVARTAVWPPSGQRINGVMAGLLTAMTSVALLAALAIDAGPASVALSTFPVFSVLVGRVAFADPVRRTQVAGVALVVTGIAAVSVG